MTPLQSLMNKLSQQYEMLTNIVTEVRQRWTRSSAISADHQRLSVEPKSASTYRRNLYLAPTEVRCWQTRP